MSFRSPSALKNLKYLDGTVLIEHLDEPVILFKGEDDTQRDDLHSFEDNNLYRHPIFLNF